MARVDVLSLASVLRTRRSEIHARAAPTKLRIATIPRAKANNLRGKSACCHTDTKFSYDISIHTWTPAEAESFPRAARVFRRGVSVREAFDLPAAAGAVDDVARVLQLLEGEDGVGAREEDPGEVGVTAGVDAAFAAVAEFDFVAAGFLVAEDLAFVAALVFFCGAGYYGFAGGGFGVLLVVGAALFFGGLLLGGVGGALALEEFGDARLDRALALLFFGCALRHRVALAARRCCFSHYDGFRFSVR
jgi:hypothetical protein